LIATSGGAHAPAVPARDPCKGNESGALVTAVLSLFLAPAVALLGVVAAVDLVPAVDDVGPEALCSASPARRGFLAEPLWGWLLPSVLKMITRQMGDTCFRPMRLPQPSWKS